MLGKRSRSAATICVVSSIDSVVWVTNASFARIAHVELLHIRDVLHEMILPPKEVSNRPIVPSTSGWPAWPISIDIAAFARVALTSMCTLVTSGHVASNTVSPRVGASASTARETPCAEKITVAPSGTSSSSSTNTAPRARSRRPRDGCARLRDARRSAHRTIRARARRSRWRDRHRRKIHGGWRVRLP